MWVGGAEGDPERDGRRTLVNGWESRLWRLEDKYMREGRPRPLRIRHRKRRSRIMPHYELHRSIYPVLMKSDIVH